MPPWKLFRWFRRPQLCATVIGSFITTICPLMHHVLCRIFCETWNYPGDLALLWPRLDTRWLLTFPKTNITFEREELLGGHWDSRKYEVAADGDLENCVRGQGAYFEGLSHRCPMYHVYCIFFNKRLYFSYYVTGYLMDRPHTLHSI